MPNFLSCGVKIRNNPFQYRLENFHLGDKRRRWEANFKIDQREIFYHGYKRWMEQAQGPR
jgi:hypothetical protein